MDAAQSAEDLLHRSRAFGSLAERYPHHTVVLVAGEENPDDLPTVSDTPHWANFASVGPIGYKAGDGICGGALFVFGSNDSVRACEDNATAAFRSVKSMVFPAHIDRILEAADQRHVLQHEWQSWIAFVYMYAWAEQTPTIKAPRTNWYGKMSFPWEPGIDPPSNPQYKWLIDSTARRDPRPFPSSWNRYYSVLSPRIFPASAEVLRSLAASMSSASGRPRAPGDRVSGARTATPSDQPRRGKTRVSAGDRTRLRSSSELAKLDASTPALSRDDGSWLSCKKAAKAEGLATRSLATYRSAGDANPEGTFGCDPDGRIWRKSGTPHSHPWYLAASLITARKTK